MQSTLKPIYETFVDHGKLVFRITGGQFKDVTYAYESLTLDGGLKYKLKSKKSTINESNKILFEQEIRNILRDKLSKIHKAN